MTNGDNPPARIRYSKIQDGKLQSHLEWPKTATNNSYISTQELQASNNLQEMVSNDTEPYKGGKDQPDDSMMKKNLGAKDDTDTHL